MRKEQGMRNRLTRSLGEGQPESACLSVPLNANHITCFVDGPALIVAIMNAVWPCLLSNLNFSYNGNQLYCVHLSFIFK